MTYEFTVQFMTKNTPDDMKEFRLDEVSVTDSYYNAAQTSDITFLKKFDNDRLLSRFRETAGLPTGGKPPYGGWENSYIGGHSMGHYLTACAQGVLATGDDDLKTKLNSIVSELKKCQDKLGTGFLFGAQIEEKENVEKQFDIVEGKDTGNTWVPWYTMHKLIAGLVDVYKFTENEEALTVAKNLGTWVYHRVSKWSDDTRQTVLSVEYGGMNDCLYDLYACSNDENHRDAAHKFDEPALYEKVTSGKKNTLQGQHANAKAAALTIC